MAENPVDRRTLTKGVLWSVPVVVVASPAPAIAASPTPELTVSGRGSWNRTWDDTQTDGYRTFKFYTVPDGSSAPGPGICIKNSTSSMEISRAMVTYYVPYTENIIFYTGQPGRNGWSSLTADYARGTEYYLGTTYFPFTTVYTGSITAQDGQTCFPGFGFESQQGVNSSGYFFANHTVVVDGRTLAARFGPIVMTQ